MQADLDLAKQRLKQKDLALVIAKNGKIVFETELHGINGLLNAMEQSKKGMKGSSVADKIVGRAAALLLVYSGVVAAFGVTASDGAIQVLKDYNVFLEFEKSVACILNYEKNDVCPFEKLTACISNPLEAYKVLKQRCG